MISKSLTEPQYWDDWWSDCIPVDPLRAHWPEFGESGFFLRAMERQVGPLSNLSVVELGGSMSNRLVSMAKWRGVKATVVDYSEPGLACTQKLFSVNGCSVELIKADFFSDELRGKRFDLVTHWGVLEHFVDPFPLIQRTAELTAPNGHAVFSMPQMLGPGAWLWRKYSPKSWPLSRFHSDESIYECFRRIGFSCKRIFWGPPLIHMTPCETSGLIPSILGQFQFLARQLARFRVLPFDRGVPYISENRGFVAKRIS